MRFNSELGTKLGQQKEGDEVRRALPGNNKNLIKNFSAYLYMFFIIVKNLLKTLHCSKKKFVTWRYWGFVIWPNYQISVFIQLMQIKFGCSQLIEAGNQESNQKNQKKPYWN